MEKEGQGGTGREEGGGGTEGTRDGVGMPSPPSPSKVIRHGAPWHVVE